MVEMKEIRAVARRIAQEFHPDRVILFGSHTRGEPTPDSDVDLLVIMPFEGTQLKKSVEVALHAKPPFPTDILVRTPENVRQRIEMGDCFMIEIIERGKVLYEADHRRVGRKGGRRLRHGTPRVAS